MEEIEKRWGIDLSLISKNGKSRRRLDYVIKTDDMIYGIEVNFYHEGGSKLNSIARSYLDVAIQSKKIEGFTFIWLTDGAGWKTAKNDLEVTYDELETMYNINDLETGIIEKIK